MGDFGGRRFRLKSCADRPASYHQRGEKQEGEPKPQGGREAALPGSFGEESPPVGELAFGVAIDGVQHPPLGGAVRGEDGEFGVGVDGKVAEVSSRLDSHVRALLKAKAHGCQGWPQPPPQRRFVAFHCWWPHSDRNETAFTAVRQNRFERTNGAKLDGRKAREPWPRIARLGEAGASKRGLREWAGEGGT